LIYSDLHAFCGFLPAFAFTIVEDWCAAANASGTKTAGYGARVGEPISRADLASAVEQLRTVLATVPVDPDHCAYLRGVTDTLTMLAALADGSGQCPETKVSGCGPHIITGEAFPRTASPTRTSEK
jgi:hypothetical protein